MRWIYRLLSAVVVLVIALVAAFALIPAERIAGLAAGQFQSLTGRALQIDGSVRASVWPRLGVVTGPVAVANAPWSDQGPMLQADGLAIAVDMAALIRGEVRITGIEAISPRLILERSAGGEENWVFGGASGGTVTPDTPGVGAPFSLDRATVSDGSFTYLDHTTGQRIAITALDAVIGIPDYTGPASADISAVMNGQPFAAQVAVGGFQDFLDGKLGDLTLTLTAADARLTFDGRAGHAPMMAEGALEAELGDLAALSRLAGTAPPALPQGFGAGGISVAGGVTLTPEGSAHLREGTVKLAGTALNVAADLTPGEARPRLVAQVAGGVLDLTPLTGGASEGGGGAEGWPRDSIDISALGALDAKVALSLAGLKTGFADLGATRIRLTLDRARAVFDIARAEAYGGAISGQFVANGRSGLSVGGDLAFADLSMQALLSDLMGYDRLVGQGTLRIKFLGVGNSVAAIMDGLEGSGSLALGAGEIRGLDIPGMLRTLDAGHVGAGQTTVFDSLSAGFSIDDGVLRNEDLALTAPYLSATGAGAVGLGARTLDYRLRPTLTLPPGTVAEGTLPEGAVNDLATGGAEISVPLLITGPWAAPKIRLDLEALARGRLEDEARALEAAARARAQELEAEAKAKLAEELGIEQQEGEDLQAAARRRAQEVLEDEAARALERLLGGD